MTRSSYYVVAVLFMTISVHAALTQSGGCYQIGSADDLYEFAALFDTYDEDALATRLDCAKLTQDIVVNKNVLKADGTPNDGSFKLWESIRSFEGTFDGQNHTISGLYQVEDEDLGLFRKMAGTIKNLGIVDSYFFVPIEDYNSSNSLGTLVSYVADSLIIESCFSSATVESAPQGRGIAGLVGFVGKEAKLMIRDSWNVGLISSDSTNGLGGLVGYANGLSKVSLINSYNAGTIRGKNDIGGLIGYADKLSTITLTNSYNAGSVSGNNYVGGLIGFALQERTRTEEHFDKPENYGSAKFLVERCYNSGRIYSEEGYSGGLVGHGQGTIKESYNIGAVDGASGAGGLIGRTFLEDGTGDTLRIESSYNRGTVERIVPKSVPDSLMDLFYSYVGYVIGGFVGKVENVATLVANSYNAADIVHDGKVENLLIGADEYSDVKMENLANKKVANGTVYEGVVTADDSLFNNGVVATYLHEYNKVWGQETFGEGKYPDFSGKVNASIGVHSITWHTFDGDTSVYPSKYAEGLVISLPANVEREGYLFDGWYAVAKPTDKDLKLEKIGPDDKGNKTLYAQWLQIKKPKIDNSCYAISDVAELYGFASIVNGTNGMEREENACGKLTQDIVVNEQVLNSEGKLNAQKSFRTWIPMENFKGAFDGNGHVIYGLYFNNIRQSDIGFVGDGGGAIIKNLKLEDFYFKGDENVGGFVGYVTGKEKDSYMEKDVFVITNSFAHGLVEGHKKLGGFIGQINETSVNITNSYNSSNVSGSASCGGFVGRIYHFGTIDIQRCYNTGYVTGVSYVGGLVGEAYGYPKVYVVNSYNQGRVSGLRNVAGILGWMKSVSGEVMVLNSYNVGEIVLVANQGDGNGATLVGYGEGGSYSFDNAFYLNQPKMKVINVPDSAEAGRFAAYITDSNFTAVTEAQLMGGAVADSLRGWYEKDDDGKPCENGQDGFAWAEDPAGTKILPHLNWDNVKHRVILVVGDGGKIAKDHEVTYYEEGVPVNLPDSQFVSREGYFFVDWYDNSNYSGSPKTSVDVSGTNMKVYYAKWEIDSTLISSSSEVVSSSSAESSSSAKSSSSISSSSSAKSSSSSAKSSSSSVKSSSSSAKSSSSSAKSSSSSSSKGKSSSSKTNLLDKVLEPQFSVNVVGRTLQVAGARTGTKYALFDMQGNKVRHGFVQGTNFDVDVPATGRFVLQIGSAVRPVTVKY